MNNHEKKGRLSKSDTNLNVRMDNHPLILETMDDLIERGLYSDRSEFTRSALRAFIGNEKLMARKIKERSVCLGCGRDHEK